MAVKDIGKSAVEAAIEEFRGSHLDAMLEKYGGGPSTKWYLAVDGRLFDQKLIIRAAHVHQGLGELAPAGAVRFGAKAAKRQLERLGYGVVAPYLPPILPAQRSRLRPRIDCAPRAAPGNVWLLALGVH